MKCRGCGSHFPIRAQHRAVGHINCTRCDEPHPLLICKGCDRILATPNASNKLAGMVVCPNRDCRERNEV